MSRMTINTLGFQQQNVDTDHRHPLAKPPTFRVSRRQAEGIPRKREAQEFAAPDWSNVDEDEFLGSPDSASHIDSHSVFDDVAESGAKDAISVTNAVYDMIDQMPQHELNAIGEAAEDGDGEEVDLSPVADGEVPPELPDALPTQDEFDDFEELGLHDDEIGGIPQPSMPAATMPPPSRRPSVPDTSEEVPHTRSTTELSPFVMAFALWCQIAGISRQHYQSLLEVFDLLDSVDTLRNLPRTIGTLKKYIYQQLPLMKLRKQNIAVNNHLLPTQNVKHKKRKTGHPSKVIEETIYFFDPKYLFTTILASPSYRKKIHIGMAHFVDEPKELFHSMAWACSIRSTSGEYATNHDGTETVLPSDTVYYRCSDQTCWCKQSKYHLGRVYAVGKDFTKSASSPGAITILVHRLLPKAQFKLDPSEYPMSAQSTAKELLLVDKDLHHISQSQIFYLESSIVYDYRYEGPQTAKSSLTSHNSHYVVRNVWDPHTLDARPIMLLPPLRGELELQKYGRAWLLGFSKSHTICLPTLTFIDAFGLYRNMYRSITGIYTTIAGLDWRERKRRSNVLPLALGPHGSSLTDVIKALEPHLAPLDEGLSVTINDETVNLCVFTLAFTADMKQQNENAGFGSPLANRGCGKCLVTKLQKADLTFNILLNARTHHRVLLERRHAENLSTSAKTAKYLDALGMTFEQTPLVRIAPALDIVRSRPGDAAHSELAGITKQAQECLLDAILTPDGVIAYASELRTFPFPPTWGRLQSPHHLGSYRMQECARLSIITPILLRTWLLEDYIQPLYLKAAQLTISPTSNLNAVDSIVQCFALMAKSNAAILSHSMTNQNRDSLKVILLSGRKAFQRLWQCAALASASDFKKGELPVSSRDITPTVSRPASRESSAPATTRYEDSELRDLDETEFDKLAESFTVGGKISKKAQRFRGVMSRPNVHAGLHYDEVASEYATPNNVTTFSGEDKHRGFKADVYNTNFRDVTKVLLSKEAMYQTIRFALAGSFAIAEPELTSRLSNIHKQCPNLLDALLPFSEQTDEEQNEAKLAAEGDHNHEKACGIGCIKRSFIESHLGWPLWPGRLGHADPFSKMLVEAYNLDYQEPNITLPPTHGIQWCQKLVFTDRYSEHRIVFKVNDFITFRSSHLARIEGVFLHELWKGRPRLFVYATIVENLKKPILDPVLLSPYLKMGTRMIIVGLPAIGCKKHYVMNVMRVLEGDGRVRLTRGGEILLLDLDYDIQFM